MPYSRPQPLERGHAYEGFGCGEPELDRWLAEHAMQAQRAGTARVFVSTADEGRVAGYYALAAAEIRPKRATARARRGQSRWRAVPAVLLARLAVDLRHQGRGLGSSLLQDAMLRSAEAAEQVGLRAMLVHAKSERACRWYERFGFEVSPVDPLTPMLLMKDLRAFLDAPQLRRIGSDPQAKLRGSVAAFAK